MMLSGPISTASTAARQAVPRFTRFTRFALHGLLAAATLSGLSALSAHAAPGDPAPAGNAEARRAQTTAVAERAFAHFSQGLATGQWQPFLDLLSDDFVLHFPQGKYRGRHEGKAKADEFFRYVSSTFVGGLKVTDRYRMTVGESTVVIEFEDEGALRGEPYTGRVALSWDIRGDRITAYREYFGGPAKP
jgi:ketosteroid isomerase-like protein